MENHADPKHMLFLRFNRGGDGKKYPDKPDSFLPDRTSRVLLYYDKCEIAETLFRMGAFPLLYLWDRPGRKKRSNDGDDWLVGGALREHSNITFKGNPYVAGSAVESPTDVYGFSRGWLGDMSAQFFKLFSYKGGSSAGGFFFLDTDETDLSGSNVPALGYGDSTARITWGSRTSYRTTESSGGPGDGENEGENEGGDEDYEDSVDILDTDVVPHTVGGHVFPSPADYLSDAELEDVTVGDATISLPPHHMWYSPETDSDGYDTYLRVGSNETATDGTHFSSGASYGTGAYFDGTQWAPGLCRRFTEGLHMYPEVSYEFTGTDVESAWDGDGDETAATTAMRKWGLLGSGVPDGGATLHNPRVRPSGSGYASSVNVYPPPLYKFNYWDHHDLPSSFGQEDDMKAARSAFRPPAPDLVLPRFYAAENVFPPDKDAMDARIEGIRAEIQEFPELSDILERTLDQAENGPHCLTFTYENNPLFVYAGAVPTLPFWFPRPMYRRTVDSFHEWFDRLSTTVIPVDPSRVEYTLDVSEEIDVTSTSSKSVTTAPADGSEGGTTSTEGSASSSIRGSFSWRGTGRPENGTGSPVCLPGISVDGPLQASLPSLYPDVDATVSSKSVEDETTSTTTVKQTGHQDVVTGGTTTTTESNKTTVEGSVSVKMSKFRPLAFQEGTMARAVASYTVTRTGNGGSSETETVNERVYPSGGKGVPLLGEKYAPFVKKARLAAVVKVEHTDVVGGVRDDSGSVSGAYSGESEAGAEGSTTYTGSNSAVDARSGAVGYRLVDLGSIGEDGYADGEVELYDLLDDLEAPDPSGEGVNQDLADLLVASNGYSGWSDGMFDPDYDYAYHVKGSGNSDTGETVLTLDANGDQTGFAYTRSGSYSEARSAGIHSETRVSLHKMFLVVEWDFGADGEYDAEDGIGRAESDRESRIESIEDAIRRLLELETYETGLASDLADEADGLKQDFYDVGDRAEDKADGFRDEASDLRDEIARNRARIAEIDGKQNPTAAELAEKERLQDENAGLEGRAGCLERNAGLLDADAASADGKGDAAESSFDAMSNLASGLAEDAGDLAASLSGKKSGLAGLEADVQALQARASELEGLVADAEEAVEDAYGAARSRERELADLANELEAAAAEAGAARREVESGALEGDELAAARERLEEAEAAVSELEGLVEDAEAAKAAADAAAAAAAADADALSEELDGLPEAVEDLVDRIDALWTEQDKADVEALFDRKDDLDDRRGEEEDAAEDDLQALSDAVDARGSDCPQAARG